jgi:hypothetical protein
MFRVIDQTGNPQSPISFDAAAVKAQADSLAAGEQARVNRERTDAEKRANVNREPEKSFFVERLDLVYPKPLIQANIEAFTAPAAPAPAAAAPAASPAPSGDAVFA